MTTPTTPSPKHSIKEEPDDGLTNIYLSSESSSESTPTKSVPEENPSAEAVHAAEIAKAHQETKRHYETIYKYAFEHDSVSPRTWCTKIGAHSTFSGLHTKLRFVRILKYSTISGPLFIFAEYMEPVTSEAIQWLQR